MSTTKIISELIPLLMTPVSVAVMGWWLSRQLEKVDQISTILNEVKHLQQDQIALRLSVERLSDTRDDVIVLKRDMKSQWVKLDELKKLIQQIQ